MSTAGMVDAGGSVGAGMAGFGAEADIVPPRGSASTGGGPDPAAGVGVGAGVGSKDGGGRTAGGNSLLSGAAEGFSISSEVGTTPSDEGEGVAGAGEGCLNAGGLAGPAWGLGVEGCSADGACGLAYSGTSLALGAGRPTPKTGPRSEDGSAWGRASSGARPAKGAGRPVAGGAERSGWGKGGNGGEEAPGSGFVEGWTWVTNLGAEDGRAVGLRNIEESQGDGLPPRLIDWWIESMGYIPTGFGEIGGLGTVPGGPLPRGLVGTTGEAIGTTPEGVERSLIESPIDRSGAIPTGGWPLGSRLGGAWAEHSSTLPAKAKPKSPATTRRSMTILRPIPSGAN